MTERWWGGKGTCGGEEIAGETKGGKKEGDLQLGWGKWHKGRRESKGD